MLISDAGTIIRIPVDGIRRAGRATQGVIVMRLREGEKVATLASVIGPDDDGIEVPADDGIGPLADEVEPLPDEGIEPLPGDDAG
jgi:DNA gyrase subunit A